jgi:hypothetical protein
MWAVRASGRRLGVVWSQLILPGLFSSLILWPVPGLQYMIIPHKKSFNS